MPSCCIKQCSARKRNNQPALTLHRFPRNEIIKKKWLEIIGSENIKPELKYPYVCSMHFDETSFNRTLDVVRLRDGALPSSSLLSGHTKYTSVTPKVNTLNSQPSASVMISYPQTSTESGKLMKQERQENVASEQISYPQTSTENGKLMKQERQENVASEQISYLQTSTENGKLIKQDRQENVASEQISLPENKKICDLTRKCENLRKKVKRLHETVRRRDEKIALLNHVVKCLKRRNLNKIETKIIIVKQK